jgi:hypothetical protein
MLPSPSDWLSSWSAGWNQFWFTPTDPATFALIRVLAGAMLLYTHAVWSLDLVGFFGPDGWLPPDLMRAQLFDDRPFVWSYFWWIDSVAVLWTVHIAALVVFAMLTLGIFSRIVAVLAYVAAVSYAQRITPGAYFGLDRVNCMLAMYLMLGPCGARYSIDAWLRRRKERARGQETADTGRGTGDRGQGTTSSSAVPASVSANVAIRLIQLHMCIIYFFSAAAKLVGTPLGSAWWDGTAVWWAVAIAEYQSADMTWLAGWPVLVAAMTYVTVFWELSYPALVWPRLTRPIVLTIAVLAHGGIALFLGMVTFGVAMLIGNLAFVPPNVVRSIFRR